MRLIKLLHSNVAVAFLLFCYALMPAYATNMVQLKNPQHALGQTSTSSAQHHPHHVSSQTQHQLHQQTQQQSAGKAAHPANGLSNNANGVLHDTNTGHHNAEAQDFSPSLLQSSASSQTAATLAHLPAPPQYVVHDKDMIMQEIIKRFNTDALLNDQYHILNELKRGTPDNIYHSQPPPPPFVSLPPHNIAYPWNLLYDRSYASTALPLSQMAGLLTHHVSPFEAYSSPYPVTPRFLPIMSYPQPVYVPYPFVMPPDMFYPSYPSLPQMANDYDDTMSRGAGSSRRPVSSQQHSSSFPRNSPIFYVRLPPTPYMFLPSLGLTSSSTTMPNYPNFIPYQSLPPFPSFSSVFNVPINFLANGKPTNIYQIGAPPNDIQNPLQFSNIPSNFNTRDPPPQPLTNAYRPAVSSHNYFNLPPSSLSSSSLYSSYHPGVSSGSELSSSSSTPPLGATASLSHPDSKLTALKHPYFFNGRPDDIYILPNSFNSLYPAETSYY